MIVTEEEAKTKRCQEGFAIHGEVKDLKLDFGTTSKLAPINCLGSVCMAWRWATEWVDVSRPELQERTSTTHGFCGKAGKP